MLDALEANLSKAKIMQISSSLRRWNLLKLSIASKRIVISESTFRLGSDPLRGGSMSFTYVGKTVSILNENTRLKA